MSGGGITVTDGKGTVIISGNIWTLLVSRIVGGKWGLDPNKIRVFFDGKEVVKPDFLNDETSKGGE